MFVKKVNSPLGDIYLGSNGREMVFLSFESRAETESHPLLDQASKQLSEYFSGKRTKFALPLAQTGTDFQIQAWRVLKGIPYGEIISYKKQAVLLGDAKKARAVGAANSKNPLPILVPCHRVVASNGDLTGYACGLGRKKFLLDLEQKKKGLMRGPSSHNLREGENEGHDMPFIFSERNIQTCF